jgi:hypothetical protein
MKQLLLECISSWCITFRVVVRVKSSFIYS